MRGKKKTIMLIVVVLISIILATTISCSTYALSLTEIHDKVKAFEEHGKDKADGIISTDDVEEKIIPIGQILVTIASAVLVIVTLIMAIQYLTANPEQKGKLKQQLIGLVVSVVVIYGAVGIWSVIKTFMEESGL